MPKHDSIIIESFIHTSFDHYHLIEIYPIPEFQFPNSNLICDLFFPFFLHCILYCFTIFRFLVRFMIHLLFERNFAFDPALSVVDSWLWFSAFN